MRIVPAILVGAFLVAAAPGCEKGSSNTPLAAKRPTQTAKLHALRRGELAAVETYRQAILKEGSPANELGAIRSEHEDAAEQLRMRIEALGEQADATSGVWGDFAKAVEGAAKILGNKAALMALKTGEQHGVDEYEEALRDPDLDAGSKDLIRDKLLPRQREHVTRVDALIKVL
jgi:hypothetical protein